jgi:hypothetical protein
VKIFNISDNIHTSNGEINMNAQEIFDKVATHLIKQGKVSVGEDGFCAYRGNDGLMCAVGCLIPDDIYHVDMEGANADSLLSYDLPSYFEENIDLLLRLQQNHDSCQYGEYEILKRLEKTADAFGLNKNVLQNQI